MLEAYGGVDAASLPVVEAPSSHARQFFHSRHPCLSLPALARDGRRDRSYLAEGAALAHQRATIDPARSVPFGTYGLDTACLSSTDKASDEDKQKRPEWE